MSRGCLFEMTNLIYRHKHTLQNSFIWYLQLASGSYERMCKIQTLVAGHKTLPAAVKRTGIDVTKISFAPSHTLWHIRCRKIISYRIVCKPDIVSRMTQHMTNNQVLQQYFSSLKVKHLAQDPSSQ